MTAIGQPRYRLRKEQKIVGYSRVEGNTTYYSKDTFWWNGASIEHNIKDLYSGWKDKNDRLLYENDIIRVRYYDPFRKSQLFRIRSYKGALVLTYLDKEVNEELLMLNRVKSIEWISFTFINLEAIFGVSKQ